MAAVVKEERFRHHDLFQMELSNDPVELATWGCLFPAASKK
jgi:hypothetical protein